MSTPNIATGRHAVAIALLLLAGCGQSPEHGLKRAELALSRGQASQALTLVNAVLATEPDRVEALVVKARALMALSRLEESGRVLAGIIEGNAEHEQARIWMVRCMLRQAQALARHSDFLADPAMQQQFGEALATGNRHAEWLVTRDGMVGEALQQQALLALQEAHVVQLRLADAEASLETEAADAGRRQMAQEEVEALKADDRRLLTRAEDLLLEAVKVRPEDATVRQKYVSLLARRQAWTQLLQQAEHVAKSADAPVPPSLAGQLVNAVINTPETIAKLPDRIQLGRDVLAAVPTSGRQNVDWLVAAARLDLFEGHPGAAERTLKSALEHHAGNFDARYLMGQALYDQRRYRQARIVLDRLSLEATHSDAVLALLGSAIMQTGDLATARDTFARALQRNPDNKRAREGIGQLLSREETDEARRVIVERAYEDQPEDPQHIRWMLRTAREAGDLDEYRTLLDRAAGIEPLNGAHLDILVRGYLQLGEAALAEPFARQRVEASPERLDAHLRLAEVMLRLDRTEDARRVLADTADRFPDAGSADSLLGQMLVSTGQYDRAIPIMERVIEQDPDATTARLTLARALIARGRVDAALQLVESVLQDHPGHPRANDLAARTYQILGRADEAAQHLARIDLDDIDEEAYPALAAQLLEHAGRLDEAAELCERAIAAHGQDAYLPLILVRVLMRQEKYDRAAFYLGRLVRLQPEDPSVYDLLARYHIATGTIEKGLKQARNLERHNLVLGRRTQARLLIAQARPDEAIRLLAELYADLLGDSDPRAPLLAGTLASAQVAADDPESGFETFERMIAAGYAPEGPMLQQVDLHLALAQREEALNLLDKLADQVGPDQAGVRRAVLDRYVRAGGAEAALAWLDRIAAQTGPTVQLLQRQGSLLLIQGKANAAAERFRAARELAPERLEIHRSLVAAERRGHRHPEAIEALDAMGRIGPDARKLALAEKIALYLAIGFEGPAVEAAGELAALDNASFRASFLMGRAYAANAMNEQAVAMLSRIPANASVYPAAQMAITRLELAAGRAAEAGERLAPILADPTMAARIAPLLVALNPRDRALAPLLVPVRQSMATSSLPTPVQRRWLECLAALSATEGDWGAVLNHLSAAAALEGETQFAEARRLVVLVKLNRTVTASETWAQWAGRTESPLAPMLADLLGQAAPTVAGEPPLSRCLRAMRHGEADAARRLARSLPPHRTVFRSDVLAALDQLDARAASFSALGLAWLALQTGLPELAREEASALVRRRPDILLAHALLAAACAQLGAPPTETLTQVRQHAPDSTLARVLAARAQSGQRQWAPAVAGLHAALALEPDNWHLHRELAQCLRQAGEYDEAIQRFEQLAGTKKNPYRLNAANELAYLLANHHPDRLDAAFELAARAREVIPDSMALRDTVGWIEHLRGRNAEALAELQPAVESLNAFAEVHYHLGAVYKALGNDRWATRHLDEALSTSEEGPWLVDARRLAGR